MNRLWKWLLYSDAKAPLLVALPFFLAVCAWLGWQELHRVRAARAEERAAQEAASRPRTPPALDPVEGLGVLSYVTNQLSPDTLIIPVDPFLPTFEALVVSGIGGKGPEDRPLTRDEYRERQRDRPPGGWRGPGGRGPGGNRPGGGNDDDWNDPRAIPAGGGAPAEPPPPRLTYNGFFQRPDGVFAPLFRNTGDKSTHFAAPGATVAGVKVLAADKEGARVQTPDGAIHDLRLGGGVDLPRP